MYDKNKAPLFLACSKIKLKIIWNQWEVVDGEEGFMFGISKFSKMRAIS